MNLKKSTQELSAHGFPCLSAYTRCLRTALRAKQISVGLLSEETHKRWNKNFMDFYLRKYCRKIRVRRDATPLRFK